MDRRSEGGAAIVVVACVLLLLLVVGGGGAFFVLRSQRVVTMETMTRMEAVRMQQQAQLQQAQALSAAQGGGVALENTALAATEVATDDAVRAAVASVLGIQEKAWNDGNLDVFMAHYWNSEDLTFSSGGGTTRGWTATMKRYRERYPSKDEMGRLTLSDFEITPLGDAAALVLGKWKVERDSEPLEGNFSLVMRKLDGRWVVIHDHTSRRVEEK